MFSDIFPEKKKQQFFYYIDSIQQLLATLSFTYISDVSDFKIKFTRFSSLVDGYIKHILCLSVYNHYYLSLKEDYIL